MTVWRAFRTGLACGLRYPQMLLLLFVANLIGALALAVLPAGGLAAELGHRTAMRDAADGVDAWLVIETLMSSHTGAVLGQGAPASELSRMLQQATLLGTGTAAALPVLAWVSAAFLSGGVLLTYAEAPQSFGKLRTRPFGRSFDRLRTRLRTGSSNELGTGPFRGRRFLWGCWHWFGAFLLLGAVQAVASAALFVSLMVAAVAAIAAIGAWLAWVVVPLLAVVGALWLSVTECTRIVAVVGQTRNVARAFGRAVRFVLRNLPAVGGLYGLGLVLLGALHALYRWGLMAHMPLDWWPLVLIVQQTFILARLGARLVRWAGGVALVRRFVALGGML